MVDIQDVLANVPDYKEYLNMDQLNTNSENLANSCPDTVKLLELGKSSKGQPIRCLKIGDGKFNALIYGFPNPEEPLGGVLLEYFSHALANNKQLLKQLDYTWYIIKCIDPDGARLTEGFLKGPFTPLNFAKNYYRTPTKMTGEMCFPYRIGEFDFNNPTPETKALMNLMNQVSFDFISSLHNMKWGGMTYQVSEACPYLYPLLQQAAKENKIPLRKRGGTMLAPGIQLAGYFTPVRNYVKAKIAGRGPLEEIPGAFVFEYAQLFNPKVFMMVPECTLWYDPRLWDDSISDATIGDIINYKAKIVAETNRFIIDLYEKLVPLLTKPSSFSEMLKYAIEEITKPAIIVSDPEPKISKEQMTQYVSVSVKVDEEGRIDLYRMWNLGALIRMIDHELTIRQVAKSNLEHIRSMAISKLEEWNKIINDKYVCKTYPIQNLLRMNLGAILYSTEYVKWKRTYNRESEMLAMAKMTWG